MLKQLVWCNDAGEQALLASLARIYRVPDCDKLFSHFCVY